MKKLLILALFLAPSVAFAAFNVDLHYGSKGDDVLALQEFLTSEGVYSGPITGNFYSLTLGAVRKYQKINGISPVSGYVGPITRGVINAKLDIADTEGEATVTPIQQAPIGTVGAPTTPILTPEPVTTTTEVTQITSNLVDIKINGNDGTSTVPYSGCIVGGKKTCGVADVQWTAVNASRCGIDMSPNNNWSGNWGISGVKQASFSATTTVTVTCDMFDGSKLSDSAGVQLQ